MQDSTMKQANSMEISPEHCAMMPKMAGCEQYENTTTWATTWSNHAEHSMTMNHADMVSDELSFISEMIPHHQEAVDTSRILIEKTQNPKLKTMLENIIAGQSKEITMMKWRLSDFYSWSNYKPMYMNMMRDTFSISDTKTLEKMYMEDMVLHHQWAVDMANKLLQIMDKQDPLIRLTEAGMKYRNELRQFANDIITAQSKEIQEFKKLLAE